jgi:hypothetical protein
MARLILITPLVLLSACALVPEPATGPGAAEPVTETLDSTPPPPPPVEARTAEEFDTTTAEDRAAALAQPAAATEAALGTTVVSLGPPTDPGIWIETPLVSAIQMGRVDYGPAGTSIAIELRPSGGAAGSGSQISLAAMRLLEIPLTALAEVTVYSGG